MTADYQVSPGLADHLAEIPTYTHTSAVGRLIKVRVDDLAAMRRMLGEALHQRVEYSPDPLKMANATIEAMRINISMVIGLLDMPVNAEKDSP